MTTFWERVAHSVDCVFSLLYVYLYICYFPFGFEGMISVLIASSTCSLLVVIL